ncbi:hypothetical protein [Serratia sp. DD3]|uniref:hypothetical protein n=1 Tax=Serratia sp. DD3 TaxID=1410619 RepID=UPI0005629DF6|nr:hypothetical protein [Serratia sp. DD3]
MMINLLLSECEFKQLLLEEGTPVPAMSGRKLKYNKSKNMIQMTMGKLQKVKMDDFFEDLNAHWRGGSARYQLACMDEAAGKSSNK